MYEILNVPGRAGVRMHSANYGGDEREGYSTHLKGCIALGKRRGELAGQKAILISKPAISEFEVLMNRKPFELEIRNDW